MVIRISSFWNFRSANLQPSTCQKATRLQTLNAFQVSQQFGCRRHNYNNFSCSDRRCHLTLTPSHLIEINFELAGTTKRYLKLVLKDSRVRKNSWINMYITMTTIWIMYTSLHFIRFSIYCKLSAPHDT